MSAVTSRPQPAAAAFAPGKEEARWRPLRRLFVTAAPLGDGFSGHGRSPCTSTWSLHWFYRLWGGTSLDSVTDSCYIVFLFVFFITVCYFFSNFFELWLVESTGAEPRMRRAPCAGLMSMFTRQWRMLVTFLRLFLDLSASSCLNPLSSPKEGSSCHTARAPLSRCRRCWLLCPATDCGCLWAPRAAGVSACVLEGHWLGCQHPWVPLCPS